MDKINLQTLVEAAIFVDLQGVHGHTRGDSEAPRQLSTSPKLDNSVFQPKTDLAFSCSVKNEDDGTQFLRRGPGSGARENHNKLEKNRRAYLKKCFESLQKLLPASQDDKKLSHLNILHNAIIYIQILRKKEKEYENEIERLAREKFALTLRQTSLKNELMSKWELMDIKTLIPESGVPDHVGVSGAVDFGENISVERSDNVSSCLSPAATISTESASPQLHEDERSPPRHPISLDNIPTHIPKPTSVPILLDPSKWPSSSTREVPQSQVPVPSSSCMNTKSEVSSTMQLVGSLNVQKLPGDQPMTFSLSQPPTHSTSSATFLQQSGSGDKLSVVHGNGIAMKGQSIGLAIPTSALPPGLIAKNGAIYKQSKQADGGASLTPIHLAHMVTPLVTPNGTIVTPVPVALVPQGNQVTHFLTTSQGKTVTPLNIKPLMSQYLVKPGVTMVVMSQNSEGSESGPTTTAGSSSFEKDGTKS